MFALKNSIDIGYSCNKIVLMDSSGELPLVYLSIESSFILFTILNFDDDLQREYFFKENHMTDSYKKYHSGIPGFIKQYQNYFASIEDGRQDDRKRKQKVDLQKLFEKEAENKQDEFRLKYPVKLVWVPTWKCNRSCLYCGVAKIKPKEPEKRIDTEIMLKRLMEAIDQGVKTVTLHGGEPLFCYGEDIYRIFKLLTDHGVRVDLSTKNHITKETAEKLKGAGMSNLQLSLDTINDDLAFQLYGERNYLEKFKQSVKNLQKVNIYTKVNIVVSSLNYEHIAQLLVYLAQLNIDRVTMSFYREGPVNTENYGISDEQRIWLFEEIMKVEKALNFKEFIYSAMDAPLVPAKNRPICESGRISLLILPDGTCCYCDFLSEKKEFIFGNLSEQTVEEIWYSQELKNLLYPLPEKFEGSSCIECKELSGCVKRGICYLKTKGSKMFSPDGLCVECS